MDIQLKLHFLRCDVEYYVDRYQHIFNLLKIYTVGATIIALIQIVKML